MLAKPSQTTAPILALLRTKGATVKGVAAQLEVPLNVVIFVNTHLRRGSHDKPYRPEKPITPNSPRRDRGWTYLLVSELGDIYVGATTDLRGRLRSHNAPSNDGWTRGHRWRILGAVRFNSRGEAFDYEVFVKRRGDVRTRWVDECLTRATRLARREQLANEALTRLVARAKCETRDRGAKP